MSGRKGEHRWQRAIETKPIEAMRDLSQEDEREAQADEFNLNYVALDGNIGCRSLELVLRWGRWT